MDIVNQAGGNVEVAVREASTREGVLEGLWRAASDPTLCRPTQAALDRAIAYLETDPAEALANDYAVRMDLEAVILDQSSLGREITERDRWHMSGQADGLREAARMLRDRGSR